MKEAAYMAIAVGCGPGICCCGGVGCCCCCGGGCCPTICGCGFSRESCAAAAVRALNSAARSCSKWNCWRSWKVKRYHSNFCLQKTMHARPFCGNLRNAEEILFDIRIRGLWKLSLLEWVVVSGIRVPPAPCPWWFPIPQSVEAWFPASSSGSRPEVQQDSWSSSLQRQQGAWPSPRRRPERTQQQTRNKIWLINFCLKANRRNVSKISL